MITEAEPKVAAYSIIRTRETILPEGVRPVTQKLLQDGFTTGTFEKLPTQQQELLSRYFGTNMSLKKIAKETNVARITSFRRVQYALRDLHKALPDELGSNYTQAEIALLKDPKAPRTGWHHSEETKSRMRVLGEQRMTSKERKRLSKIQIENSKITPKERERRKKLRQAGKAFMTQKEKDKRSKSTIVQMSNPAARDNLRRIIITRGMENRAKLALTNPQKAKEYEHKARQPYLKTLISRINTLRSIKFPEYKQTTLVKPRIETKSLTKLKIKLTKKSGDQLSSKSKQEVIPIAKPLTPVKKPDVKIEERLQNPFIGAIRNAEFLEKELPSFIREAFIAKPDLFFEWKTIHYNISRAGYLKYTQGMLYYVLTNEEGKEDSYAVNQHLIETLWDGNNFIPGNRDILIYFGRISIEDIGQQLKTKAASFLKL